MTINQSEELLQEILPSDDDLTFSAVIRTRKKPGPAGQDVLCEGDQLLADAAAVYEMRAKGLLSDERPEELRSIPVPCDSTGKPLRRLSAKDEQILATMVQRYGDVEARNALVLANLGLVHLVANQMRRAGLRYDDLVQEGMLGLLRATETFEPERGVRFSTYCVYWIRAKIQRHLQRLDRDDIPAITTAQMEIDEDGRRRRPRARSISIDMPAGDDEERALSDVIPDQQAGPEDESIRNEREITVGRVLKDIAAELKDPRLRIIIEHRLLADEPETLAVLGERLNLSREGARLLENKVLRLARQRLHAFRPDGIGLDKVF